MARKAWGTGVQNREEQSELKRLAVLRTTASMIRRLGYDKVTLSDVADELNIAKPTIYYYFRSRTEILRELLQMAVDTFLDPLDHPEDYPRLGGLTGAQQMARFLRRCARSLDSDIGSCLLTLPREVLDEETRAQFRQKVHPVDGMGRAILKEGVEDGSIVSCDVPATYLIMTGALRHIPTMHFDQGIPIESLTETYVALLLRGIEPRGPT
jgi:AcrR family transcriptional regulator